MTLALLHSFLFTPIFRKFWVGLLRKASRLGYDWNILLGKDECGGHILLLFPEAQLNRVSEAAEDRT